MNITKKMNVTGYWILTIALVLSFAFCAKSSEYRNYVPGQMVCNVSYSSIIDSIYDEYGAVFLTYSPRLHDYLLTTDTLRDLDSLASLISSRPGVAYCYPNYLLFAPEAVQASQPFIDAVGGDIFPQQMAAQTLNLDSTHDYTTGSSATVGIIDVGVDFSHLLLNSNVSSGYDFVDDDSISQDEPGGAAFGHGTFVAGIVRLTAPDAHIIAYRVLDTSGSGNGFYIADAIVDAVADSCNVINLSLVMAGEHPTVAKALEYARQNNVLVVAAAGNDSALIDKFPASDANAISVAAVDSFGNKADFSNYSSNIDLAAPGTGIYASFPGNQYARWDGTSFAAPFVSGQAALLFALNPQASWDEVRNSICSLAVNIDSLNPGFEGLLGSGLIDPLATVSQNGSFVCGDVNNDAKANNILDLTYLVDFIFRGGPIPANLQAANFDGVEGQPNILDLTYIVDYIFRGGQQPACFR